MRYPIGIQDFENIRTHRDTVLRDYPQDALDQIDEKGYGWPFMAGGRKVFKMGAAFSAKNRRLENRVLAVCDCKADTGVRIPRD